MDKPKDIEVILIHRFLPETYAIDAIESGQLKLGRIRELNDPFEFSPIAPPGSKYCEQVHAAYTQINENMFSNVGILCFSASPHDPVVWSHYSQGHRGIALGFLAPLSDTLFKVEYDPEGKRPVFDPLSDYGSLKHKKDTARVRAFYGIKSPSWSYENEYRKLYDLTKCRTRHGMYFHDFKDAGLKLVEVVLGFRCSVEVSYLKAALSERKIDAEVKRASLNPERFWVEF